MELMEIRRGLMMGMAQGSNIRYGTFTAESSITSDYNIPHGLGSVPNTIIVLNNSIDTLNLRRFIIRDTEFGVGFGIYGRNANSGNKNDVSETTSYAVADDTNITLKPGTTPWGAGEYIWVAIK